MKWLVLCLAFACSGKQSNGAGSGTGSAPPLAHATTCDDVKARVQAMYRDEAQAKEPKRVDDAVADNTTMVMNDCAKDPAKTVPCLATVPTVTELEKQCLIPIDDEGTEGRRR